MAEPEKEEFLYSNIADAATLLESLTGAPRFEAKLPSGESMEQLYAAAETTFTGLRTRMREATIIPMP